MSLYRLPPKVEDEVDTVGQDEMANFDENHPSHFMDDDADSQPSDYLFMAASATSQTSTESKTSATKKEEKTETSSVVLVSEFIKDIIDLLEIELPWTQFRSRFHLL